MEFCFGFLFFRFVGGGVGFFCLFAFLMGVGLVFFTKFYHVSLRACSVVDPFKKKSRKVKK